MIRMLPIVRIAMALVVASSIARAEVNTSHHKAVFREINENLSSFTKVTAQVDGESGAVDLTGWLQDGVVRKIVATPGNTGAGVDEYYLEAGKPLFVFCTRKHEESGEIVEERIYFADGQIVQWLTTDPSMVPHSEDYTAFGKLLTANTSKFLDALGPVPPPQTLSGTFLGIEQGDYAHWKMKTPTGEAVSFFLLRSNDTLDPVLANPEKFVGKSCRITWMSSLEDLESAGGRIQIDQITHVTWE